MKGILFSDSPSIKKIFSVLKGLSVENVSVSGMTKALKNINEPHIAYIDINGIKNPAAMLQKLLKNEYIYWGICDPKGDLQDPAQMMRMGFIDYIGKDLCKQGYSAKRFAEVNEFIGKNAKSITSDEKKQSSYIVSGNEWKSIRIGSEYTFCMMYVELDRTKEIKRSHFGSGSINPAEMFKGFVEKSVHPFGGKIWMWMDFCGLVLFLFDGKENIAASSGVKLMLDGSIFSIEESFFGTVMSFKSAVHIGNTVFRKRGDTGEIISDSINSVFHLGQKFTEFGDMTITEEALLLAPSGLSKLFIPEDEYEGRNIFRLRRQI